MASKKPNVSRGGGWIVRNLVLGVVFVGVVIAAVSVFLSVRTRHGKEVIVPDFSNMQYEDATHLAWASGLQVLITDSIYMRRMAPGAIVGQQPKAGAKVKPDRKISLTINSTVPKKVAMPNLIHVSLRQASAELQSRGLMLGKLSYVSDIATNNVLRQQIRGRDVEPGTEIYTGSVVDLVLGLNDTDAMTFVPDVHGQHYLSAVQIIHDHSLNVSRLVFDKSVKNYNDSLSASVYSQRPAATGTPTVMGSGVTLYLSLDEGRTDD